MWKSKSLTGRGKNSQFTAVFETGIHPHDDTPPDRTHQQALSQVPHKHGDGLFLRCTGQFGPADDRKFGSSDDDHNDDLNNDLHDALWLPVRPGQQWQNQSFV